MSGDRKSISVGQLFRLLVCFCGILLFLSGVAALCVFLIYITTPNPSIYIEQFDVISPDQTSNSTNTSRTIRYGLRLRNNERDSGIDYNALNLTFYYKRPNLSFVAMGNARIDPFYQGLRRSVERAGQVQTSGVVWESSIAAMFFKVELRTTVKHWLSRRRYLAVGAQVQVDNQGRLTKKNRGKILTGIRSGGRQDQH